MVVAGSVEDYNETIVLAMRTRLASATGLPVSSVEIRIAPASVRLLIFFITDSEAEASAVAAELTEDFADASMVSYLFAGANLEQAPTVRLVTMRSLESSSDKSYVPVVVGVLLGWLAMCVCLLFPSRVAWRQHKRKASLRKASQQANTLPSGMACVEQFSSCVCSAESMNAIADSPAPDTLSGVLQLPVTIQHEGGRGSSSLRRATRAARRSTTRSSAGCQGVADDELKARASTEDNTSSRSVRMSDQCTLAGSVTEAPAVLNDAVCLEGLGGVDEPSHAQGAGRRRGSMLTRVRRASLGGGRTSLHTAPSQSMGMAPPPPLPVMCGFGPDGPSTVPQPHPSPSRAEPKAASRPRRLSCLARARAARAGNTTAQAPASVQAPMQATMQPPKVVVHTEDADEADLGI